MKYLYTILLILSFLPLSAAQYLSQRDSSIYVVKGYMQRLQDELIVSFELSIDRELSSNESVVLEPMIQDSLGREMILPKIYINSPRQHVMFQRGFYKDVDLSNAIQRKNGSKQNFRYLESRPYSDWMKSASLIVNEESCGCGLPVANDVAFTTAISTTYSLPAQLPMLAFVMPEETALKFRVDKGSAFILFPLNDTVVYPSFGDNQKELDKITNSIDIIKQDTNCMVTEVGIHGYASPEGRYRVNEMLSRGRSNAVKKYIDDMYNFPKGVINSEYTPEDWIGFEALLEGSFYRYKSEILKIMHSNITPDKKEALIRTKYPQFFKMAMDDWFIMLRHTDYVIEYEVCFFNSIEQIKQTYDSNPKNLSLNELFQLSQHYEEGSDAQGNVFMNSVMLYPDDPVANLNAACVALRRRDITAAKRYLDLSLECNEKDLALGVYYLLIEKYDEAIIYLKKADNAGVKNAAQYMHIYESCE
ncbi:MAG: hypothetical protein R3Y50_08170 [Rikenellaceae bacterium]